MPPGCRQAPLKCRAEVDQQLATRQPVKPGERRVDDDVVLRGQHAVADALVDDEPVSALGEVAGQALRCQVAGDGGRKAPAVAGRDRVGIQAVGEDLQFAGRQVGARLAHLGEGDGQ